MQLREAPLTALAPGGLLPHDQRRHHPLLEHPVQQTRGLEAVLGAEAGGARRLCGRLEDRAEAGGVSQELVW